MCRRRLCRCVRQIEPTRFPTLASQHCNKDSPPFLWITKSPKNRVSISQITVSTLRRTFSAIRATIWIVRRQSKWPLYKQTQIRPFVLSFDSVVFHVPTIVPKRSQYDRLWRRIPPAPETTDLHQILYFVYFDNFYVIFESF